MPSSRDPVLGLQTEPCRAGPKLAPAQALTQISPTLVSLGMSRGGKALVLRQPALLGRSAFTFHLLI